MARDIPIGNGNLLIAFDKHYQLREFFFPHVGQENHTSERPFRFGVWVNGKFSWLGEEWDISKDYLNESLVTQVVLTHKTLKLRITANDLVDFHENIYLKKLKVENLDNKKREVRLFFCHDFCIYGNNIGDTAAFRPDVCGMLHYKGDRYFLVNTFVGEKCGIDQYACGEKDRGQLEGTWRDAEDGELSKNPIAQGSVDSVIASHLTLDAKSEGTCFYWICAGEKWEDVKALHDDIIEKKPDQIFKRTLDYWKLWVNKESLNCELLSKNIARLYKRSLLIIRTQIDNCGSIIAANDSDNLQFNRDTYSYMWPRDASFIAYALDLCGYSEITRRFFNLCRRIIQKEGYFLHKYNPSGSVASSWHPWIKDGKKQLPIQEDETALVIWALWNHYKIFKDIEFIKPLYKPLIKRAADFMVQYRDEKTKLPLPSYDLWEEHQGVLTYTTATVYAGLMAASNFVRAFGEIDVAEKYMKAASEIKVAMEKHLYSKKEKRFLRMINFEKNGEVVADLTIDSSLFGVFAFGVFEPEDEKVKNTMEQVYEKLWCKKSTGGLARYEDDFYHRTSSDVTGNPWFITTLWLAQYHIAIAKTEKDMEKAKEIMEWVAEHALPSGVLSEQIDPFTKEPLSVSPLTWSHGEFIHVVQNYINKLLDMINPPCKLPKFKGNGVRN